MKSERESTINFVLIDFPRCMFLIYPQLQQVTCISKVGFPAAMTTINGMIEEIQQLRKKRKI